MTAPGAERQLIAAITAEIARATGRRYAIRLDGLDVGSLREFLRLLRDVEYEKTAATNRARRMPWRRG